MRPLACISAVILLLAACSSDHHEAPLPPRSATVSKPFVPAAADEPAAKAESALPGPFDYWLMALSWSPTWCEANPDNREQCGSKGFGFVLHGLWPQYQRGGGPQDCPTRERVDERTIQRSLGFMPSRGLIIHQWRSHGACSGLGADDYFRLADRAYAAVNIPEVLRAPRQPPRLSANAVRDAFVQANPMLDADALRVICKGDRLSEVRICLDADLDGRRCGSGTRSGCPTGNLRIAVVR